MNIWEMRRAYLNIRRLRQILAVLAKHGFSHFLERMRIADHLPWVGRLITESGNSGDNPDMDIPNRLAAAFEELGPVYVKLGQMLAIRPDLVTKEFRAAFSRLQDKVPAIPGEEIMPVLAKALGRPVADVFAAFDPAAIASGSIGQAHAAVLRDGGREVIVKIKRPGIEKQIAEDSSLLAALAALADEYIPELAVLRPKMIASELSRTLQNELDFLSEAAYAAKFRQSLEEKDAGGKNKSAPARPRVHVPEIFWEHAGRDVLVMERVKGRALGDGDFLSSVEKRRAAALLADCFMKQYFETGLFHGDPHPGNILCMPDGDIALIDFGQTGRLSEELRRSLGRMLIALKDGDTDSIVDMYTDIGEFAPEADIQGFRFDLANFIDRNYGVPADRVDFTEMAQESLSVARRNGLYLPRDFVLLVKSLMLVAGVVRHLDPGFRLDVAIAPAVRRLALKMYRPDVMARRGVKTLSRFAAVFRRIPEDFRDLMDKAREGRFTINFHHDNLQGVADRTGRAVDRLTLGIIAAAIIVGSSIVLSAGQAGALSGYVLPALGGISVPVILATLGFLLALVLAAFVSWGIFRDKN